MNERITEAWRRIVEHDRTYVVEVERLQYGSIHRQRYGCTWGCGWEKCGSCTFTDEELVELCQNDGVREDGVWFEVDLCSWSHYGGSDLDRANGRVFGGMAGVEHEDSWGVHDEGYARMVVGHQPDDTDDEEWASHLEEIASMVESLDDYPILDESVWSELEMEIADEMWDAYLSYEVGREIEKLADVDDINDLPLPSHVLSDPRDLDDIIRCAYYEYEDNEWIVETASSAYNGRHDDAVRYAAETVFGLVPA